MRPLSPVTAARLVSNEPNDRMHINEHSCPWHASLTLQALQQAHKPDADVVILNGFPIEAGAWATTTLAEDDRVVLIRRGEALPVAEITRLMQARHTPGVAERLAQATVGIAGVGGLGSHVAMALTRTGVGRLILADFDLVEPSNLNRQAYQLDQLGACKVDALAHNLAQINPAVQVHPRPVLLRPDNIRELFQACAVVVECLDRAEAKSMLVETVLQQLPEATVVAASGVAGHGRSNEIHTRRVRPRLFLVGDETSAAAVGQGLMAPRVMIAAGHQANAVLRILLGELDA